MDIAPEKSTALGWEQTFVNKHKKTTVLKPRESHMGTSQGTFCASWHVKSRRPQRITPAFYTRGKNPLVQTRCLE